MIWYRSARFPRSFGQFIAPDSWWACVKIPRTVDKLALLGAMSASGRGASEWRTLDAVGGSAWVVKVPHWTEVPDHFEWAAFAALSGDGRRRLAPEALQQEALLAHTDNFYVIPDQFGVVEGHLLILPKEPATSIACLDPSHDDEVMWLVERASKVVASADKAQVVVAEHGDCGCATNKQAHIHVLPIPGTVAREDLTPIVDDVLARRMAGIECIAYRDAKFTALEDLRHLFDVDGAEVVGEQIRSADLTIDGVYPSAAREITALEQPYVYFRGPGIEFLSPFSLRSQFAREVVARATGVVDGSWDRRAFPNRANMFATYEKLSPVFQTWPDGDHSFQCVPWNDALRA